jgi:two-component system, sensor histidine kinase PdtaS
VPTLNDLARSYTSLRDDELEWLHSLVSDWQLLADLSFADLILWAPTRKALASAERTWIAIAQMRPTTGPTSFQDDVVGTFAKPEEQRLLDVAQQERRIWRESDPDWTSGVPVRTEAIPVTRHDQVIAVIERCTNLNSARTPSRLELTYLQGADDLARMVAAGTFPFLGADAMLVRSPRVGDGLLRLGKSGKVTYASPNALSAYRRLGLAADLIGAELGAVTTGLCATDEPLDESLMVVAAGRAPREAEVEGNGSVVHLRSIPLIVNGQRTGALVLVRDVTELRHRERELLTKEATIREIHHRVKNNLQTVAALLRLQARRVQAPEARDALAEAVRRVGSIAVVHETLSHASEEIVDFDDIAERVIMMAGEVSAAEVPVVPKIIGSFGLLSASMATPLAMVLTELLQNALQHGLARSAGPALLEVSATRESERLCVTVSDNGAGLPAGFDPEATTSLGLQIVRTLVVGELGGRLRIAPRPGGGTEAMVDLPVSSDVLCLIGHHVPGRTSYSGPDALSRAGHRIPDRTSGARPATVCRYVLCRSACLGGGACAQPDGAALVCAALVLAHAAPDAGVLAGVDGPAEAVFCHGATPANLLGFFDLEQGRTAVPDREKELRVHLTAGCYMAPVHDVNSFSRARSVRPAVVNSSL